MCQFSITQLTTKIKLHRKKFVKFNMQFVLLRVLCSLFLKKYTETFISDLSNFNIYKVINYVHWQNELYVLFVA